MEKMNPGVKARWVAALRSGEYKQGTNHLRKNDQYCCLGVLCEIARQEGVDLALSLSLGAVTYDGTSGLLPRKVQEWAGIEEGGALPPGVQIAGQDNLVGLNDLAGYTFEQIADVIEEQL